HPAAARPRPLRRRAPGLGAGARLPLPVLDVGGAAPRAGVVGAPGGRGADGSPAPAAVRPVPVTGRSARVARPLAAPLAGAYVVSGGRRGSRRSGRWPPPGRSPRAA